MEFTTKDKSGRIRRIFKRKIAIYNIIFFVCAGSALSAAIPFFIHGFMNKD
jgi:hypothetical protein